MEDGLDVRFPGEAREREKAGDEGSDGSVVGVSAGVWRGFFLGRLNGEGGTHSPASRKNPKFNENRTSREKRVDEPVTGRAGSRRLDESPSSIAVFVPPPFRRSAWYVSVQRRPAAAAPQRAKGRWRGEARDRNRSGED